MTIEQEIFDNYQISPEKLMEYGFQPDGNRLVFTKELPKENLQIVLTCDGQISGKILDLALGEEYTAFRVQEAAGFGAEVRQKYVGLLTEIREKCARNLHFRTEQARRISDYIAETYDGSPDFLWPSIPSYGAFRREGTKKWYAIMGSVPLCKVDPDSDSRREVEVINVKVDSSRIREILAMKGYYPAFHMNKKSWVSIILDDTLSDPEIRQRIDESYASV